MPRTAKGRQKIVPKFIVPSYKKCQFDLQGIEYIDYKDYEVLKKFISKSGKILSRRITGTTAKNQRSLNSAIKKSREAGYIGYLSND